MAQNQPKYRKSKMIILQKAFNAIPIIFAAFVSASFVWHFTASKTPFILSFAAALVYQAILFAVFDIARKPGRKLLFAVYITLIMLITPHLSDLYETIMYSHADSLMAGANMVDWFFASGSYTEYNPGFCCYLLMSISLPIGAAVYYYTKFYLRISVLFLIALFPPVIYAKDYESYPTFFCVILLLLFFLTIIYCRYIKTESNFNQNGDITESLGYSPTFRRSTAVFLAISLIVAIIVPKPDIDDKRQAFDDFTQNKFSSPVGRITSDFSQTSNGNNNFASANRDIAHVEANELLNLKTQCFYYYDHQDDVWYPLSQDSEIVNSSELVGIMVQGKSAQGTIDIQQTYSPAALIESIIYACNKNSTFAEKYNLTALSNEKYDLGDYESCLSYYIVQDGFYPSYFFAPENAFSVNIKSCKSKLEIRKSDSDVLYARDAEKGTLLCCSPGQPVTFEYISPSLIYDDRVQTVLRALSYDNYGRFLSDLLAVIGSDALYDDDTVYNAYYEYYKQNAIYESESKRVFTKKIRDLADDITDGLYSDYEKAKAIEQYFTESGFEYSTDYVCPEGENITHFLFESHEGSCYHYATAMTLLCRSVGLNARYCEGFSYSEKAKTSYSSTGMPVYLISEDCSHAFCEVYISGYGWMRFEPTVADSSMPISTAQIIKMVVITVIATPIAALLFTLVIFPISERLYLLILAKSGKDAALCRYIIKSLKKTIKSKHGKSAFEIAFEAQTLSGVDMSCLSKLFDACIYGDCRLNSKQIKSIICDYYAFKKAFARRKRHAKANTEVRRQKALQAN